MPSVQQLGQGILALIVAVPSFVFFLYCAFGRSNKNGLRGLALASAMAAFFFGAQYAYYLCPGDYRTTVDSILIQWEAPLWLGAAAIATVVGLGIYNAAETSDVLLHIGLVVFTTGCMEFVYISGSAADRRSDLYFFALMAISLAMLVAMQVQSRRRNKDDRSMGVIFFAACLSTLIGVSVIAGQAFLAVISANAEDWIRLIPQAMLFGPFLVFLNFTEDEKESIRSKVKTVTDPINNATGGRLYTK